MAPLLPPWPLTWLPLLLLPNLLTLTSAALTGYHMRIQPLGDSITFGYLSSDGNGYRNDLLQRLVAPINVNGAVEPSNNTVLYVGSVKSGNMTNNDNEGHSGAIITQIATYANLSLPERPNIVLLHAGTNDMTFNVDPLNAPTRISALIDQIHTQCPDALIVLAKILNAGNTTTEARLQVFNNAIPALVAEKVAAGLKVQLVDMTGIPLEDLQDGLHPTDGGYGAMSEVWYGGLVEAGEKGWIGLPVRTSVTVALQNYSASAATIKSIDSILPSAEVGGGVRGVGMMGDWSWGGCMVAGLVLGWVL